MRPAASWGGLRLYTMSSDTDLGNAVVKHESAGGKAHPVQNRGTNLEVVRMDLAFFPILDEPDYQERYEEFRRLRGDGRPHLFVHPLHGSYRAELGECRVTTRADETDRITVSAEFIPAQLVPGVSQVGFSPFAGPEAVAAAAGRTDLELAELGLDATEVTAAATETTAAWIEDGADSRRIYLEAGEQVAAIDAAIVDLELQTDYARWQAYVEMIALRTAILDCADAATSASTRVAILVVAVAAPLLTILAREYGAAAAADHEEDVAQRNDLRDRLLVPAGTRLELPVLADRRRA